jgi:flagellar basal-body rod modification protein FlgD
MEITAASTTAANGANASASEAGAKLADTFDNFLKLLTTQLQHQDPLAPMDSNEFTQQLVQFTNVEQNIATNRNLEEMLSLLQLGRTSAAVDHLGKIIEVTGNRVPLLEGQAQWTYELPETAESVTLTITNELGRQVWSGTGAASIGRHNFIWDGADSAGNPLSDGVYSLLVAARNAKGEEITSVIGASGKVTGVEFDGEEAILLVGDLSVPLSEVRKVTLPPSGGQSESDPQDTNSETTDPTTEGEA